ncbi:TetR/AcrR family transcriptional regulator C-terminal domain-containing protein [Nonomuraea sp. NPDC001636]|uniref:TetR/AcrR family transcriptional regulator C-terminal domain-containing protein n=1 Tax=Nonomuraea sp. NPDC001636 TaxID=3154391 RepID=UPI0033278B36
MCRAAPLAIGAQPYEYNGGRHLHLGHRHPLAFAPALPAPRELCLRPSQVSTDRLLHLHHIEPAGRLLPAQVPLKLTRDLLLSRPWLLDLRQSTPPMGPRRLLWLDRALDALSDTALDDGQKFNAATLLSGYALTAATLTHSLGAGGKELAARGRGSLRVLDLLLDGIEALIARRAR